MGKPKFSRKKYETPSHPWKEDRIKSENELIKKYGLKNKREIWKAETRLRKYRGQARELLAKITSDPQSKKESDQLLMHLNRMSILPPNSTLDDVLALETESILSRRLQTLTYIKGLANTPDQARQLISHGHIAIANKRVTIPSYLITSDEESEIGYTTDSPLNDLMHPARPKADYKSRTIKKDEKPIEETKKETKKEKTTEKPTEKEEKTDESKEKEKTPLEDTKEKEKPDIKTEEKKETPEEKTPEKIKTDESKEKEKPPLEDTKEKEKPDIKTEEKTPEKNKPDESANENAKKVEKEIKQETNESPKKEDKKEGD